jgi:hypothetical protein
MAVLGKSRLASSRSEFAEFVADKKPATQQRYWREYNKNWETQYRETGKTPGMGGQVTEPKKGYSRPDSEKGVFRKKEGGNRYAIVAEVKFKRNGVEYKRHYAVIKGNTELDREDEEQILNTFRGDYKVNGKVTLSVKQTIDRLTNERVKF